MLDAIKKHVFYDKPLDSENVREEIGDILFYLHGIMTTLGVSLEEIIEENYNKLTQRYPKGSFSNEDAQNRADKQ